MIELSASSAARARACPPSIRTDGLQVVTTPLPKVGLAMHHGIHMGIQYGQHLEVATLAAMFGVEDVDDLEHVMIQAWNAWRELRQYFGDEPQCEVGLAVNLPAITLTGHIDVLGFAPANRQIRIADWKSSWVEQDAGDQIRCYALLALETYPEYDEVWTAVVPPRKPNYTAQVYRREDLHEWLNGLLQRLTGRGSEQFNVGEQCLRCPRAAECPAILGLLSRADVAFDTEERPFEETYTKIRIIEAACEATRKALKAKVVAAGGRIGNLVVTEEKRETIRYTNDTHDIMTATLPLEEQWKQVLKVGKTELKKAVMEQAPRGQKASRWDQTMQELREVGAVETTYIKKLELRRCQDERTSDRELNANDGATIAPAAEALAGPGARDQPGLGSDQP